LPLDRQTGGHTRQADNHRWMNKFRSFYSVTVAKNLKSHLQVAILTALLLVTVEARQTRPVDIFNPKLKDQLDQLEKDLV